MTPKTKKLIYCLVGLLAVLLFFIILVIYHNHQNKYLRITFCDVGQGDAILIQTPYNQDILIDGGPDSSVLNCLGNHLPFYDRKIELVVLTHPHDDHFVGLIPVLERYEVDQILLTKVQAYNSAYQKFLQIIEEKNIKTIKGLKGQNFILGADLEIKTLFPLIDLEGRTVKNLNNSSIINKLIYRDNKFLFMGDLEEDKEAVLLMTDQDLSADLLKAGHHGSKTSSSQEFLKAVEPDIVVIQCGEGNKFGHPSLRTLLRFERLGAEIFRNDLDGEVQFISDGNNIWNR